MTELLYFWAPWCMPCRAMSPIAEKLNAVKINVEQDPETAARYEVYSIPTLIVLKYGEEVNRLVGTFKEEDINGNPNYQ